MIVNVLMVRHALLTVRAVNRRLVVAARLVRVHELLVLVPRVVGVKIVRA